MCAFFFVLVRPMKVGRRPGDLGSHARDRNALNSLQNTHENTVALWSCTPCVMIVNPTTSSVFEYETQSSEASKDVLFLERLDTFMEKCLGDIKAFAERELRPYEEVF